MSSVRLSTPRSDARSRARVRGRLALAVALLVVFLVAAAGTASTLESDRIIAIGDVHGSYDELVTILRSAELVDGSNQWIGGTSILVQTGDLLDRGARVREVLDLLIGLEGQAAAVGGQVVALLGNHEVNNLVGYFDGVGTQKDAGASVFDRFVTADSESRREAAFKAWNRWRRRYPNCTLSSKNAWLAKRPLGYVEYVESLAPDGRYGEWLRKRAVVARIGDTIFLHGGLSPELSEAWQVATLAAINERVTAELDQFDRDRAWLVEQEVILPLSELGELFCAVRQELDGVRSKRSSKDVARRVELEALVERLPTADNWISFSSDGPLWFRGYARWSDEEGAKEIARIASTFDASRFVVGHTPQTVGVVSRFDDRVYLIDTAMVFGPGAGGRPAALELRGAASAAVYEEEKVTISAPQEPSPAPIAGQVDARARWRDPEGRPLPFQDPAAIEEFLATAPVVSIRNIPTGVTKPKRLVIDRDGAQARAVFRHLDYHADRKRLSTGGFVMFFRDSYINEVAAYQLGRMLGLDNIPPAVLRTVDGQKGSVQVWVENATMEIDRRKQGMTPPNQLRFNRQFYEMRVFDNLIGNIDRNQGNILWDEDWQLWMIDHTRSFSRDRKLPKEDEIVSCSRTFWERLVDLDEELVRQRLAPYLAGPELRGLFERRKKIIEILQGRVAERGENRVFFNYGDPDSAVEITYRDIELPESSDGSDH